MLKPKEKCPCSWCATDLSDQEIKNKCDSWVTFVMDLAVERFYPGHGENDYRDIGERFHQLFAAEDEEAYDDIVKDIVRRIQQYFNPDVGEMFIHVTKLIEVVSVCGQAVRMDREIIGAPILNGILTSKAFLETALDNKPYPLEVTKLIDRTNERIQEKLTNGLAGALSGSFSSLISGETEAKQRTLH